MKVFNFYRLHDSRCPTRLNLWDSILSFCPVVLLKQRTPRAVKVCRMAYVIHHLLPN